MSEPPGYGFYKASTPGLYLVLPSNVRSPNCRVMPAYACENLCGQQSASTADFTTYARQLVIFQANGADYRTVQFGYRVGNMSCWDSLGP